MDSARARGVRQHWQAHKRRRAANEPSSDADTELREFFADALTLKPGPCTFDMDDGKQALGALMWKVEHPLLGDDSLASANSALSAVIEVIVRNSYRAEAGDKRDASDLRNKYRLEGLLSNLARCQSQKQVTLLTARISVAAMRAHIPRSLWQVIALLAPGVLCSFKWTESFVQVAGELRPPCPYETLTGVAGVMFDNYTRRVLYSSAVTVEKSGFLLNMTNSASMSIPKVLVHANFDANKLCKSVPT
jgi:hypothetical protein